jgi:cell division septation protein DedD
MADEAFREIQLNGKQLVFLFMTATVVAVVIFLCGVMVGRGVRVPSAAEIEVPALSGDPTAEIQPELSPAVAPPAAATTSPQVLETLTYSARLGEGEPPVERLREPGANEPVPSAPVAKPARKALDTTPAVASAKPAPAVPAEPPGDGFVVQVAAVRASDEASGMVRRLVTKGYPAFVTTSGTGAVSVYRVRVGKYKDRREAQSVAARLEKEEQFKPWITR